MNFRSGGRLLAAALALTAVAVLAENRENPAVRRDEGPTIRYAFHEDSVAPDSDVSPLLTRAPENATRGWRPKWDYRGMGGPNLAVAAFAPADGLAALVETVVAEGENAATGSRIGVLSLKSGEIVTLIDWKNGNVREAAFLPGGKGLVAVTDRQNAARVPATLAVLSLDPAAAPLKETAILPGDAAALAVHPATGEIAIAITNKKQVFFYRSASLKTPPRAMTTPFAPTALAVAADGSRLLAVGEGAAIVPRWSDNAAPGPIALPTTAMTPTGAVLIDPELPAFAVNALDQPTYRFDGKVWHEVMPRSGAAAPAWDAKTKQLLTENRFNRAMTLLRLPEGETVAAFRPDKIKPYGRRPALAIAPTVVPREGWLIWDSAGALALYYPLDKRLKKWKKDLLFHCRD